MGLDKSRLNTRVLEGPRQNPPHKASCRLGGMGDGLTLAKKVACKYLLIVAMIRLCKYLPTNIGKHLRV